MERQRVELGERVRQARLAKHWSKEEAARQAHISAITWKRIEDGLSVQDPKRYAALEVLGLSESMASAGPPSLAAEVESSNLSPATKRHILEVLREDPPQPATTPADESQAG